MEIFLKVNGVKDGPFSSEAIHEKLKSGTITKTTLAWHEGLSNWMPVLAVITPRNRPPALKQGSISNTPAQQTQTVNAAGEVPEPKSAVPQNAEVRSPSFEETRATPNQTLAAVMTQTRAIGWKKILPIQAAIAGKPWNLLWVRWVAWFLLSLFCLTRLTDSGELSAKQAMFLVVANWCAIWALGLSFIIKPQNVTFSRSLLLVIPSFLAVIVLFLSAGKLSFVNSLYETTGSYYWAKHIGAGLLLALIHVSLLLAPFVYLLGIRRAADSRSTIIYYGLLAGFALGLAPIATGIVQDHWDSLRGGSVGMFGSTSLTPSLVIVTVFGLCGAVASSFVDEAINDGQNSKGWILAGVVVASVFLTWCIAFLDSWVGLVGVAALILAFTTYLKVQHPS